MKIFDEHNWLTINDLPVIRGKETLSNTDFRITRTGSQAHIIHKHFWRNRRSAAARSRGLADSDSGRTTSHEDLFSWIRSWPR